MKAGILTFHRANNYGAVLQAAAFQSYINDTLCECEIIDYYHNNAIPPKPRFLRKLAHIALSSIRPDGRETLKREKGFDDFRKRFFRLSSKRYFGDQDILRDPPEYDVIISGSDQILNTELTGGSRAFYLAFDTPAKKISYASSFGRSAVPKSEEELIKEALPGFDEISVRESDGVKIIERITGLRPVIAADPVLLLDRNEWNKYAESIPKLPEKYIFVYSMENSRMIESSANELSKALGLPVISIRGGGRGVNLVGTELKNCGPMEFLGCIRGAEYVITNSFHGAVFAMIFGKKLISVAHSKRNSRLESLLIEAGVPGKQLKEGSDVTADEAVIDGAKAYLALEGLIKRSEDYLSRAILSPRDGAGK